MTIFNSNVFPSPNISFGKFRYEKQKQNVLRDTFYVKHNRSSKTWMRSVKKETLFTIAYQYIKKSFCFKLLVHFYLIGEHEIKRRITISLVILTNALRS